uniref:Endopeptidase S2P n=1 Tax=Knipowitschia caucasica TaxID=637954 RepID=A0AAV2K5P3_KNICA
MIPVSLLIAVMAGWCAVYLADTMLRSSVTHRISYELWLASRGLMLSPFHVRWQTTMFNRLFAYCARIRPRVLNVWFNSGLVFGVVSMVGSVVLLVKTLQQTLAQMTTDNPRIGGQQTLQVVVPGVNLPTNQLGYFFVALLLSGVIHELGHAVAALREESKRRRAFFAATAPRPDSSQDEESVIDWAPLDLPPVPAEWGDCEDGEVSEVGSLLTLDEVVSNPEPDRFPLDHMPGLYSTAAAIMDAPLPPQPNQRVEDFTSGYATTRGRRRTQPTLCPRMDPIVHYATREEGARAAQLWLIMALIEAYKDAAGLHLRRDSQALGTATPCCFTRHRHDLWILFGDSAAPRPSGSAGLLCVVTSAQKEKGFIRPKEHIQATSGLSRGSRVHANGGRRKTHASRLHETSRLPMPWKSGFPQPHLVSHNFGVKLAPEQQSGPGQGLRYAPVIVHYIPQEFGGYPIKRLGDEEPVAQTTTPTTRRAARPSTLPHVRRYTFPPRHKQTLKPRKPSVHKSSKWIRIQSKQLTGD